MPNGQAATGVTILRVAVASVFVIHGVARIVLNAVDAEYSALIFACLLVVAMTDSIAHKARPRSGLA